MYAQVKLETFANTRHITSQSKTLINLAHDIQTLNRIINSNTNLIGKRNFTSKCKFGFCLTRQVNINYLNKPGKLNACTFYPAIISGYSINQ